MSDTVETIEKGVHLLPSDVLGLTFVAVVFVAYHIYFYFRFIQDPMRTNLGKNTRAVRAWVDTFMYRKIGNRDIVVAQALLNGTFVNTFLFYSTAVMAFTLLSFAFSVRDQPKVAMQVTIVAVIILISFYNFSMVARIVLHAVQYMHIKESGIVDFYLTSGSFRKKKKEYEKEKREREERGGVSGLTRQGSMEPIEDSELMEEHIENIRHMMVRQNYQFWLGMRCIYIAVPFGMWIGGAGWMSFGSIIMLIGMAIHDRP